LELEQEEILSRLGPLRSGSVKPVSKEEKDAVKAALKFWTGVADKRRKIAKEMWGMISESVSMGEGIDVDELKVRGCANET
jgi:26S proteasome regulatory subunit, ATPase 3, interacting protein